MKEKIISIFRRYVKDEGEIELVLRGDDILKAVSLDSLALLQLVGDLEKEMGIEFDYTTILDGFKNIEVLEMTIADLQQQREEE